MYDIGFARKLDKGTSNVEIEGEVTYVLAPNHIEPKPGGKQFNAFWSQFIVLADDTGEIGVNLTFGDEGDQVKKRDRIKVKGKIDEYEDRDGVLQKKLVGREVKEKVEQEEKDKKVTKVTNASNAAVDNAKINEKELKMRVLELAVKVIEKDIKLKSLLTTANVLLNSVLGLDVNVETSDDHVAKSKSKGVKEKVTKNEHPKNNVEDYLATILSEGKKVDLDDWEKIIFFAVESGVFSPGISVKEAKEKLYKDIDCYNALLNEIKTKKEIIDSIPKDDADYSQDIPF